MAWSTPARISCWHTTPTYCSRWCGPGGSRSCNRSVTSCSCKATRGRSCPPFCAWRWLRTTGCASPPCPCASARSPVSRPARRPTACGAVSTYASRHPSRPSHDARYPRLPEATARHAWTVRVRNGALRGVIGKQAVHLMKREDMDKVSKITDLWIDIGAASKAEALERVRVGDAAVLDAGVQEFPNARIVSRSIDNRIGAYVVAEALRLLAAERPKHAGVFAVATTREEIAWTGGGARTSAVGIDPHVALVVDVTHATDWPGAEKKRAGEHKLGGGPVLARGSAVSPVVFEMLVACADEEKIPFSIQAAPHDTGTDADAIYNALRGIPTGLVSVPNRYMHSPNEMVAREDLERAARLLAAFARRLEPKISFIPS